MAGIKLSVPSEIWVEVTAECRACGMPLIAECTDVAWQDRGVDLLRRIVVKSSPCPRCAREAAENSKGRE